MHGLVAALVVLPVLVMQDPTLGQRPAGGGGAAFSGGTITAPLLAPAGCTTIPYTFTGGTTAGMCTDTLGRAQLVSKQGSTITTQIELRTNTMEFLSQNLATPTMSATMNLSGFTGVFSATVGGSAVTQAPLFVLSGNAASSDFLQWTNTATPANVITMAQDSSAPSLTMTVTDGTSSGAVILFPSGASIEATVGATAGNISVTPEQVSLTASNATHDVRWHALTGGSGSTGVVIATTGTQPTCNLANHRSHWFVIGGAGVADTYEVCMKDAANVYAWKVLATP